ncbi:MAG: DegV family protein [Chloroflexi bacterium]|nr:DegV family protein [Chloroflexota bacterium]
MTEKLLLVQPTSIHHPNEVKRLSIIRIVTDSSAHLTQEEIAQLGVTVIPLQIRLNRRIYKEGVDINIQKYMRLLKNAKTPPRSLPPAMQDFVDVYYELSKEADYILSIHVSSKLNEAANIARAAAATLRGHTQITVVDSETISRGLGMIVREAALLAESGAEFREVTRLVRGLIPSIFFSFFVDDLHYLKRDDRIRPSQEILGEMLGIKPLLEIREGDLIVMEKVRNDFDVVEKLYTFVHEFAYLEELALLQYDNNRNATQLLERLEMNYPDLPIFTDAYGPTLATFIGPSAVGVIVREAI